MDRRSTTSRFALLATTAALLLSGCGTTEKVGGWLRGSGGSDTNDAVIIGAPDADTYLAELYELNAGDARKQAAILDDANSAAKLTPGPSTSLRLGLVLGSPGHAGYDPARAATLLRAVLDQQPLLTASEVSLATIYLNTVENLSAASTEASRLRNASAQAARSEEQALNARIATAEAENRRLRNELAEAEQKLEAITTIERSIRDQE